MECAADYIAQLLYKNREQLTEHTIIKSKPILVLPPSRNNLRGGYFAKTTPPFFT
jgi:hypothetical protein